MPEDCADFAPVPMRTRQQWRPGSASRGHCDRRHARMKAVPTPGWRSTVCRSPLRRRSRCRFRRDRICQDQRPANIAIRGVHCSPPPSLAAERAEARQHKPPPTPAIAEPEKSCASVLSYCSGGASSMIAWSKSGNACASLFTSCRPMSPQRRNPGRGFSIFAGGPVRPRQEGQLKVPIARPRTIWPNTAGTTHQTITATA